MANVRESGIPDATSAALFPPYRGSAIEQSKDGAPGASVPASAAGAVAVGTTLQPFGAVPEPGQVQWPSEKTLVAAPATTRSPFSGR